MTHRTRGDRPGARRPFRPAPEALERRALLAASLGPIGPLSVPSQQGYVVPLDGSGTTDPQTFTVTSNNPDVVPRVAAGPFWALNVTYTDPTNAANNFSGDLTFDLFGDLTPNTVKEITSFTASGFYNGKNFHRIASDFPGPNDYVVQGGSVNGDGTGLSGLPGTPFDTESVQSLFFNGSYQLGMARSQSRQSNDTQFFITTAPATFLDYNYTLFGQLVSGAGTVNRMTQVPVQTSQLTGEKSSPLYPPVITSATVSQTNPNGALILDTTQARPGETATIVVKATDSVDHTTTSRTFTVTVGAYEGSADPAIDLRPLADNIAPVISPSGPTTVTLPGHSGYPDAATPATLTYALTSQPAHGVVTQFNASTGTFVYTPNAGFQGTDAFTYTVTSTGPTGSPATLTSNPATVTMTTARADEFTATGASQAAVYRPSTAGWSVQASGATVALPAFGAKGLTDVSAPADYDGTGHAEEAVYRPSTGQWFVMGPKGGYLLATFGGKGDIPVPGDYDGLGHAEPAVFRPSTGQWFVLGPTGGRLLGTFGAKNLTDVPVPGDYDGVGHTEMAVFRPSTGQWFVMGPTGGRLLGTFGATGYVDVPVPGDYDGTGKTEMAVFRPKTAQWFVLGPTGGKLLTTFGATNLTDLPANGPAAALLQLGILQRPGG